MKDLEIEDEDNEKLKVGWKEEHNESQLLPRFKLLSNF